MNEKLKDFLSAKGSFVFAVLAWITLLIGGMTLAIFTFLLAVSIELIEQVKTRITRLYLPLLMMVLSLAASGQTGFKEVPKNIKEAILSFDEQRSKAISTKDFAALDKIYSPDFKGINGRGNVIDRKALYDIFKLDNSKTEFTKTEWEFMFDGKAIIAIGKLTGKDPTGKTLFASRFMHIYEPVDGSLGWIITYGQATPIPLK